MNLRGVPESTWLGWLAERDADLDISGVPLSVLFELYPEVHSFGPAASVVEAAFVSVQDFLDVLHPLLAPAFDSGEPAVNDFPFSVFLSLNGKSSTLRSEKRYWATFGDDDIFLGRESWGFSSDNYLSVLLDGFDERNFRKFPVNFSYVVRDMLFIFAASEVALQLGRIKQDSLRWYPKTMVIREMIGSGGLSFKLDELRSAVGVADPQLVR